MWQWCQLWFSTSYKHGRASCYYNKRSFKYLIFINISHSWTWTSKYVLSFKSLDLKCLNFKVPKVVSGKKRRKTQYEFLILFSFIPMILFSFWKTGLKVLCYTSTNLLQISICSNFHVNKHFINIGGKHFLNFPSEKPVIWKTVWRICIVVDRKQEIPNIEFQPCEWLSGYLLIDGINTIFFSYAAYYAIPKEGSAFSSSISHSHQYQIFCFQNVSQKRAEFQ